MNSINSKNLRSIHIILLAINILIFFSVVLFSYLALERFGFFESKTKKTIINPYIKTKPIWTPISLNAVVHEKNPNQILYGRDLIANTAKYLGPKGTVSHISNGMNCQNCHLDAGSRVWGNNYSAVAANYPKFRQRSGTIESIKKRINDCLERSLNGKPLDSSSIEINAMVAYIKFLGQYVPKDSIPQGTGIWKLKYMDRAADPEKGAVAYEKKCLSCHGKNGEGVLDITKVSYTYPPLWGKHSYNTGAGLYRLSRLAGYIKTNMPYGATYLNPQLTDEESWDLAAFVNSQTRPIKDLSKDWPKIEGKPVDHPFGPFADGYTENQHKYGPFKPIEEYKMKMSRKNVSK